MKIEQAMEIAAQCWCTDTTGGIEMDPVLAEAFAQRLVQEVEARDNAIETAWGLIANASGGDWDHESLSKDWKPAAERWRDNDLQIIIPKTVDTTPDQEKTP